MKLYAGDVYYHVDLHQSNPKLPFLIFFHGFMGSGRAFEHILPDLKKFCNPITIDLIGHGKTEAPDNADLFTTENQIRQIHSILDRFQFKDQYAYGYSMGGRVLFQLIASYPDLFKGVCIESSHCGIEDKAVRDDRVKTDIKRAEKLEKNFSQFLDDWQSLPLFASSSEKIKQNYREIMENQSPAMMAYSLKSFGAGVMPSICEKLHQLQLPVYLVAGSNDQKYVNRMTEISKLNNHFELIVADNAGHRVHTDRPDLLINYLKKLISSHV